MALSFNGTYLAFRLFFKWPINYFFNEPTSYKSEIRWFAKASSQEPVEKWKEDALFIDKRGKLRSFNHKKVSRKKCNKISNFWFLFE